VSTLASRAGAPKANLDLHLWPRQGDAFMTRATEVLYGGAAGGGKSYLMRVAAAIWCAQIAGLQVYLFRRISDDLVKNHVEGPKGFRAMLAPWANAGFVDIIEGEIRFWNGSKIYLCHCKDEKDRFKYQGAEIHVLMIDELTHFTEVIYRFLRTRVRAVGLALPEVYRGAFPRILCGSNPGNIGHHWVKAAWIDGAAPFDMRSMAQDEGGMLRQFIPAKMADNPSLSEDDPGYEGKLSGSGSPALVKALKDGDWSVVEGAFFPEFSMARHVIEARALPEHWTRFRAMDWGSAKPFCVGWYAVSDGQEPGDVPGTFRASDIPRGALVKYREWYGAQNHNNVGLKMTVEEVGKGISDREAGDDINYGVADPAMFTADGGPSMIERMVKAGCRSWRRADNARIARGGAMGGWDQLRARLKGNEDGPGLLIFSSCLDTIRTLPALQHDQSKPEDVDTEAEDHAGDETRYACMSRPYVTVGKPTVPARDIRDVTINEVWRAHERKAGRRRW